MMARAGRKAFRSASGCAMAASISVRSVPDVWLNNQPFMNEVSASTTARFSASLPTVTQRVRQFGLYASTISPRAVNTCRSLCGFLAIRREMNQHEIADTRRDLKASRRSADAGRRPILIVVSRPLHEVPVWIAAVPASIAGRLTLNGP